MSRLLAVSLGVIGGFVAPAVAHAQTGTDSTKPLPLIQIITPVTGTADTTHHALFVPGPRLSDTALKSHPAVMDVRHSARPKYPKILQTYKITGSLRAQFVVDTTGLAEPATLKFLVADVDVDMVATNDINGGEAHRNELRLAAAHEFERAVEEALPDMRFSPAEIAGRKARQLVEQKFTFNIRE